MDVGDWLRSLGLGQYETLFRQNHIDSEVLSELTEDYLEKFGVSFGASEAPAQSDWKARHARFIHRYPRGDRAFGRVRRTASIDRDVLRPRWLNGILCVFPRAPGDEPLSSRRTQPIGGNW